MVKFSRTPPLRIFLVLIAHFLLQSSVAYAEDPTPLSDGLPLNFPELGLSISPPKNWEVLRNARGKTLIMQMPRSKERIKDYSKPLYTRNLTLAIQHETQPIDELQAQALRSKLEKDFGQAPGVSNFQILEHRFIDYRRKADAILLYTNFDYLGFAMSQMHVFTAGEHKSALLTYTDLSEDFQKNEAAATAAWNSMMSIELEGQAPQRYASLIPALLVAITVLLLALLIWASRRSRARRFFEAAERRLYSDDDDNSRRSKRRRGHDSAAIMTESKAITTATSAI